MVGTNWEFAAGLLPFDPDYGSMLVRTTDSKRMSLWSLDPSRVPVFEAYLPLELNPFPGPFDVTPDSG